MAPGPPVPARPVWTCPMCGHGSPEPRDEAAHLDAHRQLGQFLAEWESAVRADRARERRGRTVAIVGVVVAALAVLAAGVWLFGVRTGTGSGQRATPSPSP